MRFLFQKYHQLLLKRPLLVNVCSTGILLGSGDVLAQWLFPMHPNQPFDYLRTLRAVIYGSIIFAPIGHEWYKILNTKIKWHGKNERTISTLLRVGVDQLFFSPIIGIPLYYTAMTILENKRPFIENIQEKFHTSYWVTLKGNWLVWPFFQFLNFYLLPVHYRLLAVNVVSIAWNTYLSYINNNYSIEVENQELKLDNLKI
ncbi:SYM1 [Candida jiufengensis]|uniref:SYM1 n=1 Tax=Candida jiufengensis TaxID=497108 RepID=UPI002224ADD0|nr:SYM1 [Candida jiufengensis]KAI5953647.1 SYM1 [Candida jiufengensis]